MRQSKFSKLGFEIYRLTEAQENCEFLLHDVDKGKNYQYSFKRGKDMLKMLIEKTVDTTLGNWMVKEEILDPDQNVPQKVHGRFNQLITDEIHIVENIEYFPVDDRIIEMEEGMYFNIYKKPNILKEDLSEYPSEAPYIEKLLFNLVGNDDKGYEYFLKWLAWIIQYPTQRLATSVVLQGQPGSGKTMFANYVLKPLFGSNFVEIGQEHINDTFSEFMMGTQLVIANEVIYNEKMSNTSEKLKNFVTDDYVNVRRKYRDSIYIRNFCHFIFTSNQQVPVKIEKNDRRFTVFRSDKLLDGVNFFQRFRKVADYEIRCFLQKLRNVDVQLDEVNYPLMNQAKKDVIDASLDSIEAFVYDANETGGFIELNKWFEKMGDWHNLLELSPSLQNYLRMDRLYQLYLRWCQYNQIQRRFNRGNFSNKLKHLGYHIVVSKDEERHSTRVIKIDDEEDE